MVRSAVIQENRAAEEVIPENRPGTHHPSDVRQPEEELAGPVIEREPDFFPHLRQTTRVSVDRTLRFAGGSRSVKNECASFGIENRGISRIRLLGERPPAGYQHGMLDVSRPLLQQPGALSPAFRAL